MQKRGACTEGRGGATSPHMLGLGAWRGGGEEVCPGALQTPRYTHGGACGASVEPTRLHARLALQTGKCSCSQRCPRAVDI